MGGPPSNLNRGRRPGQGCTRRRSRHRARALRPQLYGCRALRLFHSLSPRPLSAAARISAARHSASSGDHSQCAGPRASVTLHAARPARLSAERRALPHLFAHPPSRQGMYRGIWWSRSRMGMALRVMSRCVSCPRPLPGSCSLIRTMGGQSSLCVSPPGRGGKYVWYLYRCVPPSATFTRDLGWTGRACSTMSRVGRYERGTYVLCVRLGAGSAHGCAHCTMQRGNCMHAESPMRLRCVSPCGDAFDRRRSTSVDGARGELGSCLSRARVFNSEPARRHAARIRALPSQCTYQPIRPLRHRWTDLRHHEWREFGTPHLDPRAHHQPGG